MSLRLKTGQAPVIKFQTGLEMKMSAYEEHDK